MDDIYYTTILGGAERAAIRLAGDARHMIEDAQSIAFYVSRLAYRYPFFTNVEKAMNDAEIALAEAKMQLASAKTRYAYLTTNLPKYEHGETTSVTELLSLNHDTKETSQ